MDGVLYKKGYALPYLRCVKPKSGLRIIKEEHEGFCRDHSNGIKLDKKDNEARVLLAIFD